MHTPGPWTCTFRKSQVDGVKIVFEIDAYPAINIAGGQSQEHLMHVKGAILEHECRANAKLMAAAPALLDELKECRDLLKAYEGISRNNFESLMLERIEAIEAAIAKAT